MMQQELPQNWQIHRFDHIAKNINERILPADAEGLPYVGLEHLDPESLKIRRLGTPDEVEAQKLHFYPGDIIFGKRRFYQRKLAIADGEGICSAHAMVLRANPEVVDPAFLPFFMQSELFFERAMSISVGSLSPTINWSTLRRQEFPLPPLEEQRHIAEILWAIEDTIEKWTQTIICTKELMLSLIAQFIPRSTESAPEDYKLGTFSSLADIDRAVSLDLVDTDAVSFIAMADISDEGGIINVQTRAYGEVRKGYTVFTEGDVLFAKITPCLENGKGAIARGLIHDAGFGSTEFFVLTPIIQTDREFIYYLSQSPILRRRAELFMQGSAGQKRLPRNFFSNFSILIPPIDKRKRLGMQLLELDVSIKEQREHVEKLRQLKATSMQKIWDHLNV